MLFVTTFKLHMVFKYLLMFFNHFFLLINTWNIGENFNFIGGKFLFVISCWETLHTIFEQQQQQILLKLDGLLYAGVRHPQPVVCVPQQRVFAQLERDFWLVHAAMLGAATQCRKMIVSIGMHKPIRTIN